MPRFDFMLEASAPVRPIRISPEVTFPGTRWHLYGQPGKPAKTPTLEPPMSCRPQPRRSPNNPQNKLPGHSWRRTFGALTTWPAMLPATALANATDTDLSRAPRHALVIGTTKQCRAAGQSGQRCAGHRRPSAPGRLFGDDEPGQRRTEMQQSIRDFAQKLQTTRGVGVFYYAGHGLQLNWRNFLVPVDARSRRKPTFRRRASMSGCCSTA